MNNFLSKCPICKTGIIITSTKKVFFLFDSQRYTCNKCSSEWKRKAQSFKLITSNNETRFIKKSYSLKDWQNIAKKDLTIREEELANLASGKIELITPPNEFVLEKNEKCYLFENSSLNEPRSIRYYQSGSRGIEIPLGKGLPKIYFGGSKGKSFSEQELKTIDKGMLILTNKKIIFKGNFKTYTTQLQKIVGVDAYKNAFRISKNNKQKPETYYVSDGEIWANTISGAIKNLNKEIYIIR